MVADSSFVYQTMVEQRGVKLRKHLQRRDDGLSLPSLSVRRSEGKKKPLFLPLSQMNWDAYMMRSGNSAMFFWITITLGVIFMFAGEPPPLSAMDLPTSSQGRIIIMDPSRITFERGNTRAFNFDRNLKRMPADLVGEIDFGDLSFAARTDFRQPISIASDDRQNYETYRAEFLKDIDEDVSREYYPNEDLEDEPFQQCRKVPWAGRVNPYCNQVHELLIERLFDAGKSQDYQVSYLK
jgi:hypothetical protein